MWIVQCRLRRDDADWLRQAHDFADERCQLFGRLRLRVLLLHRRELRMLFRLGLFELLR